MGTAATVVMLYFCGGLLVLILFDIITKRIRNKLQASVIDTQIKMLNANVFLGRKTGMATFLIVMWLFWPAVLVGAAVDKIAGKKGGDPDGTTEKRAEGANTGGAGRIDCG